MAFLVTPVTLPSGFTIADLRNIPSPVDAAFPLFAYYKLEGRQAEIPKEVFRKPQISASITSAQTERPTASFTTLVNDEAPKDNSKRRLAFQNFQAKTMSRFPSLQVNGLSSVSEDPTSATTPTERSAEREEKKLSMLRRIRPPPLKYAWNFYHDKYSDTKSYDERITLILGDIVTLKPFWGFLNNFPLHALKMKDSVHFFKRGIKPVWEDSRNINGGSWTFRIPKDKSEAVWHEILMMAVGEQFTSYLQPRDDICGVSFVTRFNSNLITIWNRDGSNQESIDGILSAVISKTSDENRPKDGSYFYKKHSSHSGFEAAVAKARADAQAKIDRSEAKKAEMKAKASESEDEALVTEEEGNKAILKDAEGEDVEKLAGEELKV